MPQADGWPVEAVDQTRKARVSLISTVSFNNLHVPTSTSENEAMTQIQENDREHKNNILNRRNQSSEKDITNITEAITR